MRLSTNVPVLALSIGASPLLGGCQIRRAVSCSGIASFSATASAALWTSIMERWAKGQLLSGRADRGASASGQRVGI